MIALAMQILFCLLIAALLGGIIGYILGRISRCEQTNIPKKATLYDYDEIEQQQSTPHKESFAHIPDATIKKSQVGIKPITLAAPKDGEADDLKKISGIGIKIENGLYELGIYHFWQIAQWSKDNIIWIEDYFSHKGRIAREEWIEQAKQLSIGHDITEH